MDLPFNMKKEPIGDYFLITTTDNETPNHDQIIPSNEASNRAIKQEPETHINESEFYEDVDENSETEQTQQDIEAAGEKALSTLFPDKSKESYRKTYDKFKTWCCNKKVNVINEKVLVTYFTTELDAFKPSSTWSIYSKLNSTLGVNDNIQISDFQNLKALLKRKGAGYKAKQSARLEKDEVFRFIKEAPDAQFLAVKVALIVGVYGACSREELLKMSFDDIEHIDGGIKVTIPGQKVGRQFVIADSGDINVVNIIKRYINLRPHGVPNSRFFIGYRQGKCTRQPIGINQISAYPGKIATFLGLPSPNQYTGHCFRRSSASFLSDAVISTSLSITQGYWSTDKVTDNNVENSLSNKRKILGNISSQKIAKLDGQSSPNTCTRITSINMPEAPEDPFEGLSSEDDAEETNSTTSKIFAQETKDEQILKKMDLLFEQQTKQTKQLEKVNENLLKLIELIAEKFS